MINRIILFAFFLLMENVSAVNLSGLLNSHDPATITKDGNTYWHFTTGTGIWSSISTNLSYWSASNKPVFPNNIWPAWINTYVSGFGGSFWAPDVIYMNNAYYIYYSCSTFGSSRSVIGVAKSFSLNTPSWIDMGMVVSSDGSSSVINAIDPGLFKDTDRKVFMTYGSWFGGIGIVEIDSITGLAISSATHLYGGSHQSIEASYLFKEDGYYYLVVNRGLCCQGVNSTYYITVGRSANVTGPYEGWRTILETEGKYIGPGHFGLLREDSVNYVSIHYYDRDANGFSKLDILKMTMVDGWPSLTRDFNFIEPTGINDEIYSDGSNTKPVIIYPNPTGNTNFFIDFPEYENNNPVSVWIFTDGGKQVFNREFIKPGTIEIENSFKEGIYLVRIKTGREIYIRKVLIQ